MDSYKLYEALDEAEKALDKEESLEVKLKIAQRDYSFMKDLAIGSEDLLNEMQTYFQQHAPATYQAWLKYKGWEND